MAFNFPNTPTEGQLFTDSASGAQYRYTNGVWMQVSAAQIKLNTARNRIVNPAMFISQEIGLDTTSNVTNTHIADQWRGYWSTAGGPVMAIRKETAHAEIDWFFRMSSAATPDPSVAAGDFVTIAQSIEGNRMADFQWGTPQALPVVLRFWARATLAGTYCLSIRNSPATHTFVKNFVLPANVWTLFVIPIPACTIGTWADDNTAGLGLNFSGMAGTTYNTGTDGVWAAGTAIATPAIANMMSAANQMLEIANVGLYLDAQATGAAPPWEAPDYTAELAACMRYYQKFLVNWNGNTTSSGVYYGFANYVVPVRVTTPALSGVDQGAVGFPAAVGTMTNIAGVGAREGRTANITGAGCIFTTVITANARM